MQEGVTVVQCWPGSLLRSALPHAFQTLVEHRALMVQMRFPPRFVIPLDPKPNQGDVFVDPRKPKSVRLFSKLWDYVSFLVVPLLQLS